MQQSRLPVYRFTMPSSKLLDCSSDSPPITCINFFTTRACARTPYKTLSIAASSTLLSGLVLLPTVVTGKPNHSQTPIFILSIQCLESLNLWRIATMAGGIDDQYRLVTKVKSRQESQSISTEAICLAARNPVSIDSPTRPFPTRASPAKNRPEDCAEDKRVASAGW